MTLESIFLFLSISTLILFLIYEVVYILFFNNIPVKKSELVATEEADVIVQPRPLGYSAPPAEKIQQCNTPVFESSTEILNTETNTKMELDGVNEEFKSQLDQNIRQNSSGKAPTIVVSSPTF